MPASIWNPGGVSQIVDPLLRTQLAAAQAGLLGFMPQGIGAVMTDVLTQLRAIQTFFYHVDDAPFYGSIQAAIDAVPNAGSARITLGSGHTYNTAVQLNIVNKYIVIEGDNSIINLTANATYLLFIDGQNCEIRNVQLTKPAGVVVTAGIYLKGLQHVLRNVTSRNCVWPIFCLNQDLKESHFQNVRVDNDVTGRTGIIFQFDYCVNNTVSMCMFGYCAKGMYGSSTAHPTFGYHTEGILFIGVIIVYAGRAVDMDNATFIAISTCIFDFIESIGVFVSNGNTLSINNTWIASNLTNNFIGVGTLAAVTDVSITGTKFVRGAAAIAGTGGVSLPGPNSLVMCNSFMSGMNGGSANTPTSQVFGNSVTGGGTDIVATNAVTVVRGGISVSGSAVADKFQTGSAAVAAVATGVATTVYTLPNAAPAMYLVTCNIGTVADVANFTAFAIIGADAATAKIMSQTNGTLMVLTLSGLNVQINQTSGTARTVNVTVTKIG